MNESEANKLINHPDNNTVINGHKRTKKISKELSKEKLRDLYFLFILIIILIIIILLILLKSIIFNFNNNLLIPLIYINNKSNNSNITYHKKLNIILNKIIPEYNVSNDENDLCKKYDPFYMTEKRFKTK